jgi:hypothetical protein
MTPEERKLYARRQVTVYAPSEEALARWKERAKKADMKLTKFIVECVESAMVEEKPTTSSDSDLITLLQRQLDEANKELKINFTNIKVKENKPEIDLVELRNLTRDVLKSLKRGGVWKPARLMVTLNLSVDKIVVLSRALRDLEDLGLVHETDTGWRYSG